MKNGKTWKSFLEVDCERAGIALVSDEQNFLLCESKGLDEPMLCGDDSDAAAAEYDAWCIKYLIHSPRDPRLRGKEREIAGAAYDNECLAALAAAMRNIGFRPEEILSAACASLETAPEVFALLSDENWLVEDAATSLASYSWRGTPAHEDFEKIGEIAFSRFGAGETGA